MLWFGLWHLKQNPDNRLTWYLVSCGLIYELCAMVCCGKEALVLCSGLWHLKQNTDNRLETLESDRIVALVGASPVAEPYRVLDLKI